MRKAKLALSAAVAMTVVLAAVERPALAQRKFLEKVRRHYQLVPRENGKCTLCHKLGAKEDPTRENLNVYGKAIQGSPDFAPLKGKSDEYKFSDAELETLMKIVLALENQDTDGDGVTNKEELDLSSFPGDPEAKPDAKELEKYRAAQKK
ncbi:MAG: hypothetical protein M5U26_24750 [Planctomycetota bacterium]|nr:hypothetical protein [Planctomycetota bacterium]